MEFLKDYIDLIIFLILGIMAFIAFWCVVERMLFFRKINFKNYENQEQFDDAISENLTTIYHLFQCPLYRTFRHCNRHYGYILRNGLGGQYRCQIHSRGTFFSS